MAPTAVCEGDCARDVEKNADTAIRLVVNVFMMYFVGCVIEDAAAQIRISRLEGRELTDNDNESIFRRFVP